MQKTNKDIKIGFFGTPEYSVMTLKALRDAGFIISFVVTMPDRPKGRKMILTPSPVKVWALEHNIPVLQPEKLKEEVFQESLKKFNSDVFVVMAYGKIIPDEVLNMPKHKTLNIHPSLLPQFRGPCPIEGAILHDVKNTGVSIIKIDSEMDHGPIVIQKKATLEHWPPQAEVLGKELVQIGSDLLVSILPNWISGKIQEVPQDHAKATYTKLITKEDGLIDLSDDPYQNYLKIQAYHDWPSAFFFKDGKRIKITQARFENGKLIIEKIIPEGKSETTY